MMDLVIAKEVREELSITKSGSSSIHGNFGPSMAFAAAWTTRFFCYPRLLAAFNERDAI